jgi:hypothetical protein
MDQIYFWILILFLVILILDYTDKYFKNKRKENFENKISDSTVAPYYEENRLYTYEPPYTANAVNISTNKNLNFKNFGTNGVTPSFLRCPACDLQYDCSNFPYDVDDKNASVCTKCFEKISFDGSSNMPVYSKAVGRPRVCRNLK